MIYCLQTVGEKIEKGETWATIHHDNEAVPIHLMTKISNSILIVQPEPGYVVDSKIVSRIC